MKKQPENKDKAEPTISKDELSDNDLEKASGGVGITKIVKELDSATPQLLQKPEIEANTSLMDLLVK